jgi:hypothetical protein
METYLEILMKIVVEDIRDMEKKILLLLKSFKNKDIISIANLKII